MVAYVFSVSEISRKKRQKQWDRILNVYDVHEDKIFLACVTPEEAFATVQRLHLNRGDSIFFYSVRSVTPSSIKNLYPIYKQGVRIAFAWPHYEINPIDTANCHNYERFCSAHSRYYTRIRGKSREAESRSRSEETRPKRGQYTIREVEVQAWKIIYAESKSFAGDDIDKRVIVKTGVSLATYYNYKRHLREFLAQGGDINHIDWQNLDQMNFSKNKYYKK